MSKARSPADSRVARTSSTGRKGRDIKAVLFDYGGTLFKAARPWTEVRAEGLASAYVLLRRNGLKITVERFMEFSDSIFEKYAEVEAREDKDIGDRIKYQDIVDALFPRLPETTRARLASGANRAFWDTAAKSYPLRKSARRSLKDLSSTGVRMGVVSNHHDYDSLVGHLEESGIISHFQVIVVSEREGVRKPNTTIFARSLKAIGVEKEHALFVGDSPKHDIMGARAAGITTVLIDDGEQLGGGTVQPQGVSEQEWRPDFVIRDLIALRGIVDSLREDS